MALASRPVVWVLALALAGGCGGRQSSRGTGVAEQADIDDAPQDDAKRPRAPSAARGEISLTPDHVFALIRSHYMLGIQHCYQSRLKKDPAARGKVTVSFTIDETGHATQRAARGFADEVDRCIAAKMRRWKFPIPTDLSGQPVQLSFMTTFNLVPNGS